MLMLFLKFDSLHRRFAVAIALIMTVLAFVFSGVLVFFNVRTMNTDLQNQMEHLLESSTTSLSSAMWQYNHEFVSDYVNSLFSMKDLAYVMVKSNDRIVVAKSSGAYEAWEFMYEIDSEHFMHADQIINYQGIEVGTVLIVLSRKGIQERLITTSNMSVSFLILILLLVSTIVNWLSVRYVFRPINQLEQAVNEISNGRLYARIPEMGTDEIGKLARAFQNMMENIRIVTASRDELNHEISERRKMATALAAEKEQLMVTLRSIGDGVITTDTDGRIVLLNQVAETLTGWTQPDACGRLISDVFNIVDEVTDLPSACPFQRVMKAGTILGLDEDTVLIARDGIRRNIADSGAPIRAENNEIIGVVIVFRDVTNERKYEAQIQQSQRMESIGNLAGGIAHDFNNMLGVIIGNLSLALSPEEQDHDIETCLSAAQDAAHQAQTLTQQLLTFARGGAPIKTAVDLNSLIMETATFVTRGEKVRCEFELQEDLMAVDVDRGQMVQSISNLLINAVQAMPAEGVIQVKTVNVEIGDNEYSALSSGKYVKINVSDQGIGISDAIRDKIFDPYFTTKEQGTGLGLATVYSIVRRHEGYIELTQTGSDGSLFTMLLPATDKQITRVRELRRVSYTGSGRILIVDDEEAIRNMVAKMLKRMGYSTIGAIDGKDALDKYRNAMDEGKPFDMVILDLTIPGGMGGAETMPELLKLDPEVVAVVSSGYSNDAVMADYKTYGFSGIIPKPFTRSDLSDLLHKLLER